MRELKFRAWDKEEKKYLLPEKQGFIIVPTSPSFGVTLPYHRGRNFSGDEDCFDWADADLLMGRYELEQYTGLKDKNGKDIYEGDIVTVKDNDIPFSLVNTISTEKWLVRFNMHRASFTLVKSTTKRNFIRTFQHIKQEDIEVIGNIHENKELWR